MIMRLKNIIMQRNNDRTFKLSNRLILLTSLFFIVFMPLFGDRFVGILIININLTLLFLSSYAALPRSSKILSTVSHTFLTITITGIWVAFLSNNNIVKLVSVILDMLLLFSITSELFLSVFYEDEVDLNSIVKTINGYLLIGISSTMAYIVVYIFDPGSFTYQVNQISDFRVFVYYAFITLTSIGFGDIAPVSDLARSVTVFFGVAGQIYLAVVVAIIVGKYSSNRNGTKRSIH